MFLYIYSLNKNIKQFLFVYFIMEKLTIEMTMKAISPYQALSEQLALPQSPRQETFWASAGIESTDKLNQ